MMSATKVFNQEVSILRIRPFFLANTSYQWSLQLLTMLIFISALALIVVTSQTRSLYKETRHLEIQRAQLDAEYEQLILERSALLTQSRVANIATRDFAMTAPMKKTFLVVNP